MATKIVFKKNPLYTNATLVALTYACIQRHVFCKQNILFINKFHLGKCPINLSIIWKCWGKFHFICYSQRRLMKILSFLADKSTVE